MTVRDYQRSAYDEMRRGKCEGDGTRQKRFSAGGEASDGIPG